MIRIVLRCYSDVTRNLLGYYALTKVLGFYFLAATRSSLSWAGWLPSELAGQPVRVSYSWLAKGGRSSWSWIARDYSRNSKIIPADSCGFLECDGSS